MDENPVHARRTAREPVCTCCGGHDMREQQPATGGSQPVVVCPTCDLQPAELQGWLETLRAP